MWGGQMSVAKTLCYLKNLTSPSHLPQKSCGCFRFPLRLIEDSGAWKLCCETMSAIHPTLKQKLTLRQGSICWAKIKQLNRNRDLNLAKLKLPETTLVGYLGLPKRTVDGFQLKLWAAFFSGWLMPRTAATSQESGSTVALAILWESLDNKSRRNESLVER